MYEHVFFSCVFIVLKSVINVLRRSVAMSTSITFAFENRFVFKNIPNPRHYGTGKIFYERERSYNTWTT